MFQVTIIKAEPAALPSEPGVALDGSYVGTDTEQEAVVWLALYACQAGPAEEICGLSERYDRAVAYALDDDDEAAAEMAEVNAALRAAFAGALRLAMN